MSGKTRKPCPGCGETGLRYADKVCSRCADKLKWADEERARQASQPDVKRYTLPYAPHALPGFNFYDHVYLDNEWRVARDRVKRALYRVAHAAALTNIEQSWNHPAIFERQDGDKGRDTALLKVEMATALSELDVSFNEYQMIVYCLGKANGQNLLVRMAAGDLTIDEVDGVKRQR